MRYIVQINYLKAISKTLHCIFHSLIIKILEEEKIVDIYDNEYKFVDRDEEVMIRLNSFKTQLLKKILKNLISHARELF